MNANDPFHPSMLGFVRDNNDNNNNDLYYLVIDNRWSIYFTKNVLWWTLNYGDGLVQRYGLGSNMSEFFHSLHSTDILDKSESDSYRALAKHLVPIERKIKISGMNL